MHPPGLRRDLREHRLRRLPWPPRFPGTHIEIGWASALGKPIVLLLEDGADYAFLVRGLHTVADVTYLTISDAQSLADEVIATVNRLALNATEN